MSLLHLNYFRNMHLNNENKLTYVKTLDWPKTIFFNETLFSCFILCKNIYKNLTNYFMKNLKGRSQRIYFAIFIVVNFFPFKK